jgi:hypothetical protein
MTIQVGNAATIGEKELRTDYPVEEGLTAGYQKQVGRISNLVAEDSLIPDRKKRGIYGR